MKTTRRWPWAVVTSVALAMGAEPRVAMAEARVAAVEPASATEDATSTATKVLVLPVELSGELPPDTATEVGTLVTDNLVDDGIEVLAADGSVPATGCDDACRRAAAERAGADFLVQARVEGGDDEYAVTVTLFAGDTGRALAPFGDECSICGFVEVRDMARLRALDARAEVLRRRREATIASEPAGEVEAAPVVDRQLAPRSKLVPAGFGLLGAGSAATVGGVVLLVLHQRSAGCLENPRGGDCVPLRYTTAPAGAALLGTGAAVLVGGVIMVVLGRRADKRALAGQRTAVRPHGLGLRF